MNSVLHSPDRSGAPTDPSTVLLHVAGVSHGYLIGGRLLAVLEQVNLTVTRGGFAAIIGPSGSGKSTLLNLIAGLEQPRLGTITIDGSAQRLGRCGYMPQRDLLHPWRSALDNAIVALDVRGVDRGESRPRARELFARFGLSGFEHARPHQLSGGMRQRVALARTLLAGGPLVLLDEPFGALDALTRAQMHQWLLETWPALDRAGLLVTHDVEEALLLADEVYVLSRRPGRIVARYQSPFPRPRPHDLIADPRFARLKLELLELMRGL